MKTIYRIDGFEMSEDLDLNLWFFLNILIKHFKSFYWYDFMFDIWLEKLDFKYKPNDYKALGFYTEAYMCVSFTQFIHLILNNQINFNY